jgi:hypothetical protein
MQTVVQTKKERNHELNRNSLKINDLKRAPDRT